MKEEYYSNRDVMMNEKDLDKKIIVLKTDKADSVEIKEDSKGHLYYTLKIYGDVNDIEGFIQKINSLKNAVEKEVLKRI